MGKINEHSPIYFMKDNWENWLNLRHILYELFTQNMRLLHLHWVNLMPNPAPAKYPRKVNPHTSNKSRTLVCNKLVDSKSEKRYM